MIPRHVIRRELCKPVADKMDLNIGQTEQILDAFLEQIFTFLKEGREVKISAFGSFNIKNKPERVCLNPQTKEKMVVQACRVPTFKFMKAFKQLFKGGSE